MSRRILPLHISRAVPLLLLMFSATAHAQLNAAYDNGYKPMLDLSGKLKDLVDSAEKREDYAGVRDLGAAYKDRLDKVIAGLENAGKNMKDASNQTWINATCSATLADAKKARAKADKLYERGDNRQSSKAEALDLQAALTELSDEFKKCWSEHEDRRQRLMDEYNTVRAKWWDATKEDRRPVDELGKKAAEARDKFNEYQVKATEAGKLYIAAQDQCDKARSELFNSDATRTPDEVKSKYEAWAKAEDLVKRVDEAVTNADKAAAEANKNYLDAQTAWEKAMDEYTKQAVEGDDLYKIVLGRHLKVFEMAQEYKPFSW